MKSILLVFDDFDPASNYIEALTKEALKELVIERTVFLFHSDKKEDIVFNSSEKLILLGFILQNSPISCYVIDGDSFENKNDSLYNKVLIQKKKYLDHELFLLIDSKKFKSIKDDKNFVLLKSTVKIVLYVFPNDLDIMEERYLTSNEIIFLNSNKELNKLSECSIYFPTKESYPDIVIEYMNRSSECAIKRIKKELSEARFKHSLRVAGMVKLILEILNISDQELAYNTYLAALYHDICKEVDISEQIRISKDIYKIKSYPSNKVLHGYVGAWFLKERYFFNNEDILRSIREHTIPSKNPSLITKILYLADHLEPLKKDKYSEDMYNRWWDLIEKKNINQAFESLRMWMSEKYPNEAIVFYN